MPTGWMSLKIFSCRKALYNDDHFLEFGTPFDGPCLVLSKAQLCSTRTWYTNNYFSSKYQKQSRCYVNIHERVDIVTDFYDSLHHCGTSLDKSASRTQNWLKTANSNIVRRQSDTKLEPWARNSYILLLRTPRSLNELRTGLCLPYISLNKSYLQLSCAKRFLVPETYTITPFWTKLSWMKTLQKLR